MKIRTSCMIGFLLLISTATAFAQPAVENETEAIIEKHILAIGGKENYDSLWSVQKEGSQNYFGKLENIRITFEKGILNRQDIELGEKHGYWMIGINEGGEYFPWETGVPVKFSTEYLKRMQPGNLLPRNALIHYKEDSSSVKLLRKDTIGMRECYVIRVTSFKAGLTANYWIDAENYMLSRMEKYYSLRNRSNDRLRAIDRFDYKNYKKVDGIAFAFTENFTTIINGKNVGTKETFYSKIEINKPVNPALYSTGQKAELVSSE